MWSGLRMMSIAKRCMATIDCFPHIADLALPVPIADPYCRSCFPHIADLALPVRILQISPFLSLCIPGFPSESSHPTSSTFPPSLPPSLPPLSTCSYLQYPSCSPLSPPLDHSPSLYISLNFPQVISSSA